MTLSNKRLVVQLGAVALTILGFFTSFQITTLVLMVATLFAGTFFCGWVCPYGTLQDLFSRLGKYLGIKKRKMPKEIQSYLKYVRYIILVLVMVSTSDLLFTLFSYDPHGNFTALLTTGSVSALGLLILVSIAAAGVYFERPFCNYLCYEGARHGLISLARPITIQRNNHSCVNCKKCDKVCPMNIEVSKADQLRSGQCINCFECVQACPVENTLTYGVAPFNKKAIIRYISATAIVCVAGIGYMIYNGVASDAAVEETTTVAEMAVLENTLTEAELALLGDAKGIDDGVYTGSGRGFRGSITVEVTVESQMITDITVISSNDDAKWFNRALTLIDEIIDGQSADISVVSGATYSSNGILDAVKDALEGAGA